MNVLCDKNVGKNSLFSDDDDAAIEEFFKL